jgi:glycosyltransferase involved in cell wall biosynthesis
VKFSLITTLYNERDSISEFLESYKNQTKHADEFIIVDGGSTDGTQELIKSFIKQNPHLNIKLIIDKTCNKTYTKAPVAKGRNIAIENTSYEVIVVTDAGCILDNNWFYEITKPFIENPDIDVVAGWYEPLIENDFQKLYAEVALPKLQNLDVNNFLPSSRSIAFKKSCWKKVRGYPEKTLTAEDTLFDINLKKYGCKFFFTEKAIVYWKLPKNEVEALKKQFNYGYGDGQLKLFFTKFLIRNAFSFFPIDLIFKFGLSKKFLLSYKLRVAHQIGYVRGLINGNSKE